jgi:hypothetical protein
MVYELVHLIDEDGVFYGFAWSFTSRFAIYIPLFYPAAKLQDRAAIGEVAVDAVVLEKQLHSICLVQDTARVQEIYSPL